MLPNRHAVIDIGTNSVKLLVAVEDSEDLIPLHEEGEQTRLGEGFYQTRVLQPLPMQRTVESISRFCEMSVKSWGCSPRVVATSAVRDALNGEAFVNRVREAIGISLEIISGDREAELVYRGVRAPGSAGDAVLVVDVGGGSTEFILGFGNRVVMAASYDVGTVRLQELLKIEPSPAPGRLIECRKWISDFLNCEVGPKFRDAGVALQGIDLIGTGGTAALLVGLAAQLLRFDRQIIEQRSLSLSELREWVEKLWGLSMEERKRLLGLPENKADVILTGSAIFEGILEWSGSGRMRASTRGLRFGAILEAAEQGKLKEKAGAGPSAR